VEFFARAANVSAGQFQHSYGGSQDSSRESGRFAVFVPWPEDEAYPSDSASDGSSDQSEGSRNRQTPVMALLSNAFGLFERRADHRDQTGNNLPRSLARRLDVQGETTNSRTDYVRSVNSAGEVLYRSQLSLDREYLSRSTRGAERIPLDDCVDICFMPNRTGTRGPAAAMSGKTSGRVDLMNLFEPPEGRTNAQSGRLNAPTVAEDISQTQVGDTECAKCHQMRFEPVD
jgi:hypothetical protein